MAGKKKKKSEFALIDALEKKGVTRTGTGGPKGGTKVAAKEAGSRFRQLEGAKKPLTPAQKKKKKKSIFDF